ncbi:sulfate transporter [Amylibacter kogurei]|uniref:Sulfate transporter n=1 Tax=Paramylibacter kogurei TaxID=1889778 RepID=A0A2G5K8I5_9RHOB|nr:SulP family inorganic anion transporter [Amylibacter kogurei]PIB25847.1 sulfate transporter [Amylibacter kogurei]
MRYPDPFPARQWLGQVTGATLRADAFAGFTNAAIVLPQGVAFATIAGLPAEYGLYTAMITAVVAAMFGSSMVMISGPTTAISAVLFATISDIAAPGSARYIELALMMTILVGLFQIAGGIGRLGGLVSFVSHSVMTAFTAAAALLIGVSQLAGAFGVHVERGGNVVERIYRLFENIGTINSYAVLISLGTLTIAILSQKIAPKLPGFLIALLAGSFAAYALDAAAHGVHMIGALPAIVPSLNPPTSVIGEIGVLAPGAAAIALVGLLEAISIGRAFAVRRKENFDANQEMIGQGMSNFIGGFFQCYAGSGSFTRSGVNATAGAMTPLSGVFASVFLLLILLFTAQLVAFIPTPAMAGLILFVAWKLIDVHEIKHIIETKSAETVILLLTLGAGLLIELDFAIYVGVIASLAVFVYESARPDLTITAPMVAANGDRKFRDAVKNDLEQCPQLVSLSIDGPLYFGSVEHVEKRLKRIRRRNPRQINMVLYLKGGAKVDLAGADLLISIIREIKSVGGSFRIVANVQTLIDSLERLHVIDELGAKNLFHSKGEAVADAMRDFNLRVCKACIRDVFRECDRLRDTELETDR